MKAYDYILLSKIQNLTYPELRCNNCSPGFIAYLESLGHDVNQEWRIDDEKYSNKNITLPRARRDSDLTDS